jgi:hypothetical protein
MLEGLEAWPHAIASTAPRLKGSRANEQRPVHGVYYAYHSGSALRTNNMIRFETALVELRTTAANEAKSRFAFRALSVWSSGGPIISQCRARVLHSTNSRRHPDRN